jgi:hypothetical protein
VHLRYNEIIQRATAVRSIALKKERALSSDVTLTGVGEERMRVAEVTALHPDAQGEVVKRWHLNLVPQELKHRAMDRCKHAVQRMKSPRR